MRFNTVSSITGCAGLLVVRGSRISRTRTLGGGQGEYGNLCVSEKCHEGTGYDMQFVLSSSPSSRASFPVQPVLVQSVPASRLQPC